MVQLESWGAGNEGFGCEGGITCGSEAGDGGEGESGATLGVRAGATLVGCKRGCMGTGEEMVCH